ncbi:MAG TPA: transaldolase family protein [Ktedonobacterales bacterium]|jgi:TalC/MipB family fructose-6-phosphate aldolase
MGLYADSAYLPDVERACTHLELAGVTTNPSILLAAWQRGQTLTDLEVARALLAVTSGLVFMQPTGETVEALWQHAERYLAVSPQQVVLKLPLTANGMQVARRLRGMQATFAFTCVFTVAQAYCAAMAGARFVIPYYGRLRRAGADASERIEGMSRLLNAQAPGVRVLAASIKNATDATEALLAGAHDLTAAPEVLEAMLTDPLTDIAVEQFERDWGALALAPHP